MSKCPYCMESVPDEAVVCPACGRNLPHASSITEVVPPKAAVRRSAGLGGASIVLGLLSVLPLVVYALCLSFGFFDRQAHSYLALACLATPVLSLTGFILGLAGAFSKKRRHGAGITGVVLNSIYLLYLLYLLLFARQVLF
jgi:hypothetical protein